MIYVGNFDPTLFTEFIEEPNWQSSKPTSRSPGMLWKSMKDTGLVREILEDYFDIDYITWVVINNMPPHTQILPHIDCREPEGMHTVHLVYSTNDEITFDLDGEQLVMKQGNIYSIDNTVTHYVKNDGETNRIHILVLLKGDLKDV